MILFQIPMEIYSPEFGFNLGSLPTSHNLLEQTWFWLIIYLILIILGLLVIFRLVRWWGQRITKTSYAFQKIILLVTVPKESLGEQAEKKSIKELLLPMENFYDNIGGLRAQRGWRANIFGRSDHISFEVIADKEGAISFYLVVPRYLQQFVEQQLQAQVPAAQIEEVEDYNIFDPNSVIAAAYFKLRNHFVFPIKTYLKGESDPLNALTNSLSKIGKGEAAAIQIVARSSRGEWHRLGAKLASEMQQGKKLSEAKAIVLGSSLGKIFRGFREATSSKSKEKKELEKKPYQLSPMEQEIVKLLEEKTSKAGFDVNVRIIVSARNKETAKKYLENITNAFAQYTGYEYGNGFKPIFVGASNKVIRDFIYRNFDEKQDYILNTEEITSLFHLPLPITETPNIRWLIAKKAPAPVEVPAEGIILGKNFYRGKETIIRLKTDDRRRHLYIIGKTGTGKSNLISNLAVQDITNGEGVCVLDPHGDLIDLILRNIPESRVDDVIYFDPSDVERPVGLNMLEVKTPEQRDFAVQEMIAIFYKLFPPEIIGPMFEHNMRNVMLTLITDPKNPGTIAEIPRMFSDPDYQEYWVAKVRDPVVRAFWEKEMAKTTDFHKSEMLGYLISKVGRFVENEMMRNIIGQAHSGFDLREIMDKQKILLVNLSKGKVGEVNANLLGLIIVSKLQMAALGRADLPEEERKDFYLYIDEFQNFVTDSIATILSEARKYRLCLTIAHQYLGQLGQSSSLVGAGGTSKVEFGLRDAVLGTVGTIAVFKIGIEDAQSLAKEFAPVFNEYDLVNIEKFNTYIKLLVDNQPTRPFNMQTMPPQVGQLEIAKIIKAASRLKYGRPKKEVEKEILERSRLGEPEMETGLDREKNL